MSNFDGTGEKKRDGGDSGAFRGRRHPFLDRNVDWKKIEKTRYGADAAGDSTDQTAIPREIDFQITSDPDPRYQRVETCVAAIKQLATNMDKWTVVRDCLIKEYQSGGPEPQNSEKALMSFIGSVNRRLGKAGEINPERLAGEEAERVAAVDKIENPELSLNIRVWHSGGLMGPIGVCFSNQG